MRHLEKGCTRVWTGSPIILLTRYVDVMIFVFYVMFFSRFFIHYNVYHFCRVDDMIFHMFLSGSCQIGSATLFLLDFCFVQLTFVNDLFGFQLIVYSTLICISFDLGMVRTSVAF